jgi:hypothetical protein
MKTILLFSFLLQTLFLQAQNEPPVYNAKYKYNLPTDLQDRRLIYHLDTLLPYVFPELSKARSCGGRWCRPDYTIEVVNGGAQFVSSTFSLKVPLSNADVNSELYEFNTLYTIRAWILLKNSAGQVVRYYEFVNSSDVFTDISEVSIPQRIQSVNVNSTNTRAISFRNGVQTRPNLTPTDILLDEPEIIMPKPNTISAVLKKELLSLYADPALVVKAK